MMYGGYDMRVGVTASNISAPIYEAMSLNGSQQIYLTSSVICESHNELSTDPLQ
jgi:hypothetical protein